MEVYSRFGLSARNWTTVTDLRAPDGRVLVVGAWTVVSGKRFYCVEAGRNVFGSTVRECVSLILDARSPARPDGML